MTFGAKLAAAAAHHGSWLCLGLDPEPGRLPAALRGEADPIARFCREIIAATADVVCAFKPNSGFFEAQGTDGMQRLADLIAAVPAGVPVILDAKRGDIGSTAEAYARAAFDVLGADAVTLSPYLGGDALAPFLERRDRGCFILCRTSNPGGAEVQRLQHVGTNIYGNPHHTIPVPTTYGATFVPVAPVAHIGGGASARHDPGPGAEPGAELGADAPKQKSIFGW